MLALASSAACLTLFSIAGATANPYLPAGAHAVLNYEQSSINRNLDTSKILALNNHQSKKYSPEAGETFEVQSFWLDIDDVNVFFSEPDSKAVQFPLIRVSNGRKQVLFLVHPESLSFYGELIKKADAGPVFEATATASSRTLMMWPEGKPEEVFFGKLSLNKEIGGVIRTIPKGEIARSVGVTRILEAARLELPPSFDFLPEFFGVMPKGLERGGMLLRSIPAKMKSGQTHIMPLFALYTVPKKKKQSPIEIMIKTSKMKPRDFIVQKILRPFIKQWLELAIDHGITVEAHAQNVLLETNASGLPNGVFVYRDFGGFNIDLAYRRERGLAMPAELPISTDESNDYHQKQHEKALRASLETYFEGGFLFGLGQDMIRQKHKSLDYEALQKLLKNVMTEELSIRGQKIGKGDFYENLLTTVKVARSEKTLRASRCRDLFTSL